MPRVNRENFLNILESVRCGLSAKAMIEQANTFVFRNNRVFTFNDEASARAVCKFDEPFSGAVQAESLLNILRQLEEEEVELSVGKGELLVRGKRGRRAGIFMEANIVLPLDAVDKPKEWKVLPADFAEAVNLCQNCAGKDESEFIFTCVHIHPHWVEACDNMQACRWRLQTGFASPTLVRRKAIKDIAVLGVTQFSETDNWVHFRSPAGVVLSCRRYVEEYQDIGPILAMEGSPVTLPKGLVEAVAKAEIFSAENSDINRVLVDLAPGKVRVKGIGVHGWYSEPKALVYNGPRLSFYTLPGILTELVKRFSDCTVCKDRLKASGGSYEYVTCLICPEETNGQATE